VLLQAVAPVSEPFPKSEQLARGPKRQHRIVATKAEWEAIAEAKQGPCRICRRVESNGSVHSTIELHHLIRRSQGGDDVPDNIVPLCGACHRKLHDGRPGLAHLRLTPSEKRYLRSRVRA